MKELRLLLALLLGLSLAVVGCESSSGSGDDDDDDNDTAADDDDDDSGDDDDDVYNDDDDDDGGSLPQSCQDWIKAVCDCHGDSSTLCNNIKKGIEAQPSANRDAFCKEQGASFVCETPECQSNNDCDDGFECKSGKCVPKTTACTSNADCPSGYVCKAGKCEKDTSGVNCEYDPNVKPFEYPASPVCIALDECFEDCPDNDQNCIQACQSNSMTGECMACIQGWQNCAMNNGCIKPDNTIDANCLFDNCMNEYFACHKAGMGGRVKEESCKAEEVCQDVGGVGACMPAHASMKPGDGSTYPGPENQRNGKCQEQPSGSDIATDPCHMNDEGLMCIKWYSDPTMDAMCTGFCPVGEITKHRLVTNGCKSGETCTVVSEDGSFAVCIPDGWMPGQASPGVANGRNGDCTISGMVDSCTDNTACLSFQGAAEGTGVCLALCPPECAPPVPTCPEGDKQLALTTTTGDCLCAYNCTNDASVCGADEDCCDVSQDGSVKACLATGCQGIPASAVECIE